jgi:hypothetical protein
MLVVVTTSSLVSGLIDPGSGGPYQVDGANLDASLRAVDLSELGLETDFESWFGKRS